MEKYRELITSYFHDSMKYKLVKKNPDLVSLNNIRIHNVISVIKGSVISGHIQLEKRGIGTRLKFVQSHKNVE